MQLMTDEMYEDLKKAIFNHGVEAIDDLLGYEHNVIETKDIIESRIDDVFDQMPEDIAYDYYNKYCTKRLHISMAYTYVGDTGIDIPMHLLKDKTEEEQLEIAYEYAKDHIDEIPVANNSEYICDSDNFEIDDIDFNNF